MAVPPKANASRSGSQEFRQFLYRQQLIHERFTSSSRRFPLLSGGRSPLKSA